MSPQPEDPVDDLVPSLGAQKVAADAAAAAGAHAKVEEEDGDDDDDDEDDGAEQGQAGSAGDGMNSKQRKKKKSKAAAKLRKKLGLGPSSSAPPSEQLDAASASLEKDLPDEVVDSLRSAVASEHGKAAGDKVNRANLAKVLAAMNLERSALLKNQGDKMKGSTQKEIRDHRFWKTQPVTKMGG